MENLYVVRFSSNHYTVKPNISNEPIKKEANTYKVTKIADNKTFNSSVHPQAIGEAYD